MRGMGRGRTWTVINGSLTKAARSRLRARKILGRLDS